MNKKIPAKPVGDFFIFKKHFGLLPLEFLNAKR